MGHQQRLMAAACEQGERPRQMWLLMCRGRMDHMAHEEEPAFHEPPACPLPSSRFAQHRDEPAP